MKSIRRMICVSALALSAVAPSGFSQAADTVETASTSSDSEARFRLSAGDVIEIRFFYNPELNETVQIRPDGHISMPLIGDVDLNGKAVEQTTAFLDQAYQKYLKTPSITLQIKSYASQKVYVGGEVPRPGAIPLAGKLTVLDALMEAGGPRHTGNNSTVVLLRKNERGTASIYKVSLKTKGREPSPASTMVLMPFDVVLVPESRVARVDRWVDQNIRQMVPAMLTTGFTYLQNATVLPR